MNWRGSTGYPNRFAGIIVLGPYRSGTSLMSRILSKLGVNFGPDREMHAGTQYNPGGYFERAAINNANDAFITSSGGDLARPGDPVELARRGDPKPLREMDLTWMAAERTWGIKDPRLCASLWAWLELGIISRDKLAIVYVERSLDDATRSGVRDPNIPDYCDGTPQGIRDMLSLYATLADWHVQQLQLPTLHLRYEDLIADPAAAVAQLAEFIGVSDRRTIRRAANVVGKNRSLFAYYVHRYLVKAPRKAFRILTGQDSFRRRRAKSR